MAEYRVVYEIKVEAVDPLTAALAMRDQLDANGGYPDKVVTYTDDYRVVATVDLTLPPNAAVTIDTPPAGPLAW